MIPLSLIATAIGLGLAYAAAPGAVNTEDLRRGVSQGARSALLIEAGSLIGDSIWALLVPSQGGQTTPDQVPRMRTGTWPYRDGCGRRYGTQVFGRRLVRGLTVSVRM